MSYGATWNEGADGACEDTWVRKSLMAQLAQQLDSINFSLQTERVRGLTVWNGLNKTSGSNIFGPNKRFPAGQLFICMEAGDWPNKASQLLSALAYKPPENTFISGNTGSKKQNWRRNDDDDRGDGDVDVNKLAPAEREKYEKALVSFYQAVGLIKRQLGNNDGVYGQKTFEAKYYLTWA